MTKAPSFVKARPAPSEDALNALRKKLARVRDISLEIADLAQRIENLKAELNLLQNQELPKEMEDIGIDRLGLAAEGNLPAYDAELRSFYEANIKADWPQERRAAGFKYLDSTGNGDLIKTAVSVHLPRDERAKAKALIAQLKKSGFTVEVNESVHNQTLKAWLKEEVEKRHNIPDLEKIGGHIGRIVRLKERK